MQFVAPPFKAANCNIAAGTTSLGFFADGTRRRDPGSVIRIKCSRPARLEIVAIHAPSAPLLRSWPCWYTFYTHESCAKAGVLDRLFAELRCEQFIRRKIEGVSLDSTIIKVHPDGTGALKKRPPSDW
jgi:hypothetical protein